MKKSKRSLILLLIVFVLLLVGCGEKTYTIQLILDGSNYESITISDGTCLKDVDTKVDAIQYDLDGWYCEGVLWDEDEPIHSNLTLSGETSEREYLITFLNENGDVLRKNKYAPYEEIIEPTTPKKESDTYYDYIFNGWDQTFEFAISDLTIHATYTKQDRFYSVKFMDGNGKQKEEKQVQAGSKLTLESVTKETDSAYQYSFWTWVDENGSEINEKSEVLGDLVLSPKFHLTPVKTSAEGLKISIVGDSISTHYRQGDPYNSYYNENNTYFYPKYSSCLSSGSQTWWAQTTIKLKANLGINNSWSGTTCTNNGNTKSASPAENDTRLLTLDENGTPDIIITYIGTNDCVSGRSKEVFYNGYKNMISKIKKLYPNAYVFCVTLGYSVYSGGSYSDELRLAYNEDIKEVASLYDATVIDWAKIQNTTAYESLLTDRLHLNLNGMNKLSDLCVETINDYLKKAKN